MPAREGDSTLNHPRIRKLACRYGCQIVNMADGDKMPDNDEENSSVQDEIERLLSSKDAKNTAKATSLAHKLFAKTVDVAEAEKNTTTLDKALANFYASARKEDGTRYKAGSFLTLRQGLRRHFSEANNIDIVNDKEFAYSTKVFKATMTDLRRRGLGAINHHSPITKTDMQKLYSGETCVFDVESPHGLLQKVWLEIMYYLCRRGQENLRSMTKATFGVRTDSKGRRYVYQIIDELDKNHRSHGTGSVTQGRMYELPGKQIVYVYLNEICMFILQ